MAKYTRTVTATQIPPRIPKEFRKTVAASAIGAVPDGDIELVDPEDMDADDQARAMGFPDAEVMFDRVEEVRRTAFDAGLIDSPRASIEELFKAVVDLIQRNKKALVAASAAGLIQPGSSLNEILASVLEVMGGNGEGDDADAGDGDEAGDGTEAVSVADLEASIDDIATSLNFKE